MPRKGATGHDEWVVTETLATALIALEQLEPKHQPRTHMDEIKKLLTARCQPRSVNLHLAQAKCRLFLGLDRETSAGTHSREPRVGLARDGPNQNLVVQNVELLLARRDSCTGAVR
jgi:hypothetical protein